MSLAEVLLWGRRIGAVSWDDKKKLSYFEYDPAFIKSGIEVSPFLMPLSAQIYSFPSLPYETFHGLPGLLADSLPDKFGNALIDAWLAQEGRSSGSFNSVERLCYIGKRGMGALEFAPARGPASRGQSEPMNVDALVSLASEILSKRTAFQAAFSGAGKAALLEDILKVGTSAGGARAKVIIAWNPSTHEVRSGQVPAGAGFSYWLLKFDGVRGNKDKELDDSKDFGLIEYAYHKMARSAGIEMTECRIFKENGRNHFMTKRFDRTDSGQKIHAQSLAGLAHYDYNQAGAYSYEQAFEVLRKLDLPMRDSEELFRRAAFNIMARNQDDHVKNMAFLMSQLGQWALAPAFDLVYSYNPEGKWTHLHQMTLNGKRDGFDQDDFARLAKTVSLKKGQGLEILRQVKKAVLKWPQFAEGVGLEQDVVKRIAKTHRLKVI